MKNLVAVGIIAALLFLVSCSDSEDNTQKVVYDAFPSIQLDTNSFEYTMNAGYYSFDSLAPTVYTNDTLFYVIDIKDYKSGSTKIILWQADTVAFIFPELDDDYYSDTLELLGIKPQKIQIQSVKFTGTLHFKLFTSEL